jgi:RNA polymerase sigma-70 factor (ECF subfamily)
MPEPNDPPVDSELLRSFYQCSEPAFDALLERWRPRLRGFFVRCGFRSDEAEDLVQEVAIRIYLTKERRAIDVRQPFGPYVRAVARNLAAREMLRKRRQSPPSWEILEDDELPEQAPPDYVIDDIYEAFQHLPDLEQSYLLLCRQHGLGEYSHSQIAVILGKSPPYITLVSKRSIGRLRKQLESKGYRIQTDDHAERE